MRGDYGDRDELMEIVARLRAVTQGSPATELSLKRNSLGQLGFHVQPDGVVTQVESMGQAWQAGLRQGSRLVEICKVAVSTLSHDQMVDLLKTSAQVTITVIPPTNEGNPRRYNILLEKSCSFISCICVIFVCYFGVEFVSWNEKETNKMYGMCLFQRLRIAKLSVLVD